MERKICTKCNIEKSLEDFDLNEYGSKGRAARCKECRRIIDRERAELKRTGITDLELCTDDYVREGAEEVLTALGYTLYNKDNPVYLQFKRRLERKGIFLSFN